MTGTERGRRQRFCIRAATMLPLKPGSTPEGVYMNQDKVAGQWKQVKGKLKEQWGKLTDDEIDQMEGNSQQLAGKIQERYGIARDEAERQARDFRTRNNWT